MVSGSIPHSSGFGPRVIDLRVDLKSSFALTPGKPN